MVGFRSYQVNFPQAPILPKLHEKNVFTKGSKSPELCVNKDVLITDQVFGAPNLKVWSNTNIPDFQVDQSATLNFRSPFDLILVKKIII